MRFADVIVILSLVQHAFKDGTIEEVKLRHLASADGATVIVKDIRYERVPITRDLVEAGMGGRNFMFTSVFFNEFR